MIKKINLSKGQSIELSSSVGWLMVYKERFGRDILPDIMPIIEAGLSVGVRINNGESISDVADDIALTLSGLEVVTALNVVWAMAYKADQTIEGPEDFFDQYEVIPMDKLIPAVVTMIVNSMVSSKNSKALMDKMKAVRETKLRSTQSSSEEQTEA